MSYFVALYGLNGWKPMSRVIHPTKKNADTVLGYIKFHEAKYANPTDYRVFDADHEPGRTIFKKAGMV